MMSIHRKRNTDKAFVGISEHTWTRFRAMKTGKSSHLNFFDPCGAG